jgi:hypothetical protein
MLSPACRVRLAAVTEHRSWSQGPFLQSRGPSRRLPSLSKCAALPLGLTGRLAVGSLPYFLGVRL